MDLKPDIEKKSIASQLLCHSCLCVGRTLHKVTEPTLSQYYLDILDEIPLFKSSTAAFTVCWECKALLEKSVAFREQVKDSYRILQTYENLSECLFSDISRPPRLKIYHCEPVEVAPSQFTEDSFVELPSLVKDEVKQDLDCVNDESAAEDCILFESDNTQEFETELTDIVSTIERPERKSSKTEKQAKKIVKKTKSSKTDTANNIITIEMTYEEMLVERQKESTRDCYVNAKFKCENCLIGFQYRKPYQRHRVTKHSADLGDYSCPICKTVIASVESFTTHYKRHLKRYECSICQKRTMDLKVMQQHYYSSHEISLKKYKCNLCGTISNSVDTHRYHKESHKARLQCPECDKTFRHRAGLMNHRLSAHESQNEFPCTECDKVFRWRTSLRRHLAKHDAKSKGSLSAAHCSMCDVSFASTCSYQRHLKNSLKHVTHDQLRYICDHCKRRFSDKTKLRDHIEEKHLHKTYQCQICLKPSKNRVALDQHMRNVHRGRPHDRMCHHCGKGFPTTVQLESHIRTHTGERPFICELCPTTFTQPSNLYKHNRQVHRNIKSKRYPVIKNRKGAPPPLAEPPAAPLPLHPPEDPQLQPTEDYRSVGVFQFSQEREYVI